VPRRTGLRVDGFDGKIRVRLDRHGVFAMSDRHGLDWPARRAVCGMLALALPVLLIGCDRQESPSPYESLDGFVQARDPEAGEFTVRVSDRLRRSTESRAELCIVTKDTEVYINDKFDAIENIRVGDPIEVIGFRERNPQLRRFFVSFAYVTQRHPPVRPPDLRPRITENQTDPGDT
jgi:hypothetical protein